MDESLVDSAYETEPASSSMITEPGARCEPRSQPDQLRALSNSLKAFLQGIYPIREETNDEMESPPDETGTDFEFDGDAESDLAGGEGVNDDGSRGEGAEREEWCVEATMVDALKRVEDVLEYLEQLEEDRVVECCPGAACVDIAQLDAYLRNPELLRKLNKGSGPVDLIRSEILALCEKIEQWYQHYHTSPLNSPSVPPRTSRPPAISRSMEDLIELPGLPGIKASYETSQYLLAAIVTTMLSSVWFVLKMAAESKKVDWQVA